MTGLDHTIITYHTIYLYWLLFDAVTEYLTGIREQGFILAQCSGEGMLTKFCGQVVVVAAGMWRLILYVGVSQEAERCLPSRPTRRLPATSS